MSQNTATTAAAATDAVTDEALVAGLVTSPDFIQIESRKDMEEALGGKIEDTTPTPITGDKAATTLAKAIAGAGIDTVLVAVLANQKISFTTEYTSEYTYFGRDLTTTWTITIGEGRVVGATSTKRFEAPAAEVIAAMI